MAAECPFPSGPLAALAHVPPSLAERPMPFGEGKHHIRQNEGLETTCSNCSQNRIHLVMLIMSYGSPDVTLQQYTHQYQTKY